MLCITGFFAWQQFAGAGHDKGLGATEAKSITIDANTLLSGNGGAMPMELKLDQDAWDQEQGSEEAGNESEGTNVVTLLWAYQAIGGRTLVSYKTE